MKRVKFWFIVFFLTVALACRSEKQKDGAISTTDSISPAEQIFPSATLEVNNSTSNSTPVPPGPRDRVITVNDYAPEQTNYVDTLVVLVNFSDRADNPFDLGSYWDRIFGLDDPIRQLNAYYNVNFYGQLLLRPVEVNPNKYVEIELMGSPQDYSFGWLIGYESDEIASVDPQIMRKLILDVMAGVVEQYPEVNYQNKFIFLILNATGAEYGRGAAGAIPGEGIDPIYDMFIGNLEAGKREEFSDPENFRVINQNKVIGLIGLNGYTYDDYFRGRGEAAYNDQFILGMAIFGKDAPLSCASHDILHGLRRKSAYADPPEGRGRAISCLYNLPLQSKWMVGSENHGRFDRSVTASPYIGWWDPMADHLHPSERSFFASHPQGMSAFTKLRMGMIPERCIAEAESDEFTVRLSPLGSPTLPAPGSEAEAMVVKVPVWPDNPNAAHVYLLLEYRRRVGVDEMPDNFSIPPDFIVGSMQWDGGYDPNNPDQSQLINPPTTFVPDEGVLVYLVNEKMPELPILQYNPQEWYKFILVLLNPAGNEKRDDLNDAALAAGEKMELDLRTLYAQAGIPIKLTIGVNELTETYAEVSVTREIIY
jgi:hypothetical protein